MTSPTARRLRFLLLIFLVIGGVQGLRAESANYPLTDRPWGQADYLQLGNALLSGKVPPPRLDNPETRPVFLRMISEQNVEFAQAGAASVPVEQRLMALAATGSVAKRLMLFYGRQINAENSTEREVSKLLIYTLKLFGRTIDLADEYAKTIPKDDKYEIRLQGLTTMKRGIGQIFSGVIVSISETNVYSKPSTLDLIQATIEYLPNYRSVLTNAVRKNALRRVQDQIKVTGDDKIKAALFKLRNALAKAG